MDKINLPAVNCKDTVGFFDDFDHVEPLRWSTLVADTGTSVAIDQNDPNGIVTITTGTNAQNSEAHLYMTNQVGGLANGKPHEFGVRIRHTEAATDDGAVLVALFDAAGTANMILDTTGYPIATYSGCALFKPANSTRWFFQSSTTTSQTTTELDVAHVSAGWINVNLVAQPISATEVEYYPEMDTTGVGALNPVSEYRGAGRPVFPGRVKHKRTYTETIALRGFVGAKNAGSNVSEVVLVDYAEFWKKR